MVLINSQMHVGSIEDDEDINAISDIQFQVPITTEKSSQAQGTFQSSHVDDFGYDSHSQGGETISVKNEESSLSF